MRTFDELEKLWQFSVKPPRDDGRVVLIVARLGNGEHEVLERGEFS